ncbi:hypothetical protein MAR_035060 [Mya arenaria]|uniref:B box-type domain-containing protein n=1 Tax=Mya arenaria TaxID=6604 RepID=A0ABY7ELV4_MYAAR|nr:hypothetical protein MAR_035060 [Mya arenaria]
MTTKLMRLALNRVEKLNTIKPPERIADDVAKYLSKYPTRCVEHEETVKRFCADHDVLICDVCGLSNHKSCQNVMGFDDASKGIRSSRDVTLIDSSLKTMISQYEKMFKEQTDILTNLTDQDREFVKAVKAFRSEINAILDRLENAILVKKENYTTQRRDIVKEHKQSCKTAMTLLDNYSKDLDRCYLGNDNGALFVVMKKTRFVMDKYEEQRKKISKVPKKVQLTFIPNTSIAKFFLTLKDFGDMKADNSVKDMVQNIESQAKPLERRSSRASLHSGGLPNIDRKMSVTSLPTDRRLSITNVGGGDISVFLDTDTDTPFITGVTFMPDDSVVAADDANRSIKVFTHAFFPVAMTALTSPPRDVAPIKPQLVATTIPSEKAIQFIELGGKELILRKKLTLDFECFGITCYNQELYVTSGFSNEREIRIMSQNGEVRKRFRPGIVDLRYPLYIEVDPRFKTIFVTDYNHGVIGLDLTAGELKFKCKDTDVHGYYKGVTMGHKGDVFVCTWNLHGVSKVHLDGRGLETIIPMPGKEGRKPHSIAFSKKSARLIISMCGGKRACLSVYRYQ